MPDDKSKSDYEEPAISAKTKTKDDCDPVHCPEIYCTPENPYCEIEIVED